MATQLYHPRATESLLGQCQLFLRRAELNIRKLFLRLHTNKVSFHFRSLCISVPQNKTGQVRSALPLEKALVGAAAVFLRLFDL